MEDKAAKKTWEEWAEGWGIWESVAILNQGKRFKKEAVNAD